MTDDSTDQPIVAVCVVSDRVNCPADYYLLDRTEDGKEDADLWRDSIFGRRCYRYLCYKKATPKPDEDVLVDVAIINEKDSVPAGFTVLEQTEDTREKSLKKKSLCFRWMSYRLTNAAISKLILLSKSMRRPPSGFTIIGDVNNMLLCFKMVGLSKNTYPVAEDLSSHHIPSQRTAESRLSMCSVGSALPYSLNPTAAAGSTPNLSTESNQPVFSRLIPVTKSPLSGVPWQLNSQLKEATRLQNITIPKIICKTMYDLDQQYEYSFRLENSAINAINSIPLENS